MKRFLHLLSGFVIWVVFVGIGGALIYANAFGVQNGFLGEFYSSDNSFQAPVMGGIIVLFALLRVATIAPRRKKTRSISFDTEGGSVSISVTAVCDFIKKLGDEFEAIKSIDPKVRSEKDMVSFDLNLKVRAGARIPELSTRLQSRVREGIREGLGIVDVREIKVNIAEIVGNPPPSVLPEKIEE